VVFTTDFDVFSAGFLTSAAFSFEFAGFVFLATLVFDFASDVFLSERLSFAEAVFSFELEFFDFSGAFDDFEDFDVESFFAVVFDVSFLSFLSAAVDFCVFEGGAVFFAFFVCAFPLSPAKQTANANKTKKKNRKFLFFFIFKLLF
jgi:hypothetical protein